MIHVMHDIKTLGTANGSVILSLGAVIFDGLKVYPDEFYVEINQKDSLENGLVTDEDTKEWWSKQDPSARQLLSSTEGDGGCKLEEALRKYSNWYPTNALVWCNGASFDHALLATAYRKFSLATPWFFRDERCYRTLKNLYPSVTHKDNQKRTVHNALSNAKHQAEHASIIMWVANSTLTMRPLVC